MHLTLCYRAKRLLLRCLTLVRTLRSCCVRPHNLDTWCLVSVIRVLRYRRCVLLLQSTRVMRFRLPESRKKNNNQILRSKWGRGKFNCAAKLRITLVLTIVPVIFSRRSEILKIQTPTMNCYWRSSCSRSYNTATALM